MNFPEGLKRIITAKRSNKEMKLTKSYLRNIIKEELEQVVAELDQEEVVPGDSAHEADPPHGPIGAQWSGTPEKGIIELKDGTTIIVYGGTDVERLKTVADLLADKGIKSIHDSTNRGAPEKVLDFLLTKHQGGTITEIP